MTEREEFEATYLAGDTGLTVKNSLGCYVASGVHFAWGGWRARAESTQQEEVPVVADAEIYDLLGEIADEEIMKINPASIVDVGRRLLATGATNHIVEPTEKVSDVAPVADRDAVLFGILMRRNIELTDEAYLSMRVVGVPPSEDEFVAALKKAIDAAVESQRSGNGESS
jgi:hypothetical protein